VKPYTADGGTSSEGAALFGVTQLRPLVLPDRGAMHSDY
jgi:hypothetical protein